MEILISEYDYKKRVVILTDSVYEKHISARHPELSGNIAAIRNSIIDPDAVHQSIIHDDTELFYLECDVVPYKHSLTTVVRYDRRGEGAVRSCYITDERKGGVLYERCDD